MRFFVAKGLQALGLVITALALFVGFQLGNARAELIYLATGATVFFVGWLLEEKEKGST